MQSLHPDGIGREKRKTGESGDKSPPLFFPLSRNLHVLCIFTEYFLTHSEDLGSALTVGTGHSQASVLVLRLFPPFGLHFHSPCPTTADPVWILPAHLLQEGLPDCPTWK